MSQKPTIFSQPIPEVTAMLHTWLGHPNPSTAETIDRLEGYGLPVGLEGREPFEELLAGLPAVGVERYELKCRLAERLAALLDEEPDVRRPGDEPDRLLYNLLCLCEWLACPEQLAEPLYAVFQRRGLVGQWRGIDLRSRLRDALAANQLDNRLQPHWMQLVRERRHEWLPGDEYDGFDGINWMPPSGTQMGQPALDAIGEALRCMSQHLASAEKRREVTRRLLDRLIGIYPDRSTWAVDLIQLADSHGWPRWMVECLPHLWVTLGEEDQSRTRAYVWHYIAACIPSSLVHERVRALCAGSVMELLLSGPAGQFVSVFAPTVEEVRTGMPYPSDAAMGGGVLAALSDEIEKQDRTTALHATSLRNAHRILLAKILDQTGPARVNAAQIAKSLEEIKQDHRDERPDMRRRYMSGLVKPLRPFNVQRALCAAITDSELKGVLEQALSAS